ncbi:putative methyltransferase DDB_G0268948 [Ambystoma mexicanum]|uniref:putative methyltransferase DDB_G0268948 n=1 Tax=Ambystoma mexicanum TaxID=8296 RepID=UPI0037E95EAF
MACQLFTTHEHATLYEKYMIREPEVYRQFLSYLEEKKGKPFELALDVGCGTGQTTRALAPHFQKVVGIDISKSQIQEAERVGYPQNVTYIIASAEQLPLEDGSVDLITASTAAHWFNIEEFLREVDRVLKPKGCLALSCVYIHIDLQYKECSKQLSEVYNEALNFVFREHGHERIELMRTEYKDIFDRVPYHDKMRFTKMLQWSTTSVEALMGLLESTCAFHTFLLTDPESANEFLKKLQERILKIMGTSSTDTQLGMCTSHFCVLACKSP